MQGIEPQATADEEIPPMAGGNVSRYTISDNGDNYMTRRFLRKHICDLRETRRELYWIRGCTERYLGLSVSLRRSVKRMDEVKERLGLGGCWWDDTGEGIRALHSNP